MDYEQFQNLKDPDDKINVLFAEIQGIKNFITNHVLSEIKKVNKHRWELYFLIGAPLVYLILERIFS